MSSAVRACALTVGDEMGEGGTLLTALLQLIAAVGRIIRRFPCLPVMEAGNLGALAFHQIVWQSWPREMPVARD